MNDQPAEKPPAPEPSPAADLPVAAPDFSVPLAPTKKAEPPHQRRDFFGEAMRELLVPFTGIIERRLTPLLSALEQIPDDAQRLANSGFGLLDQPHPRASGKSVQLPQFVSPQRYLRPPGAMAPGAQSGFEAVCSRCGKCVEACPVDAIQLDKNGLTADGLPHIVAETQPCAVCNELACMKSCPTGALRLMDRWQIHMGIAFVDHQLCLRDHGENCTLCIDVCPVDGKDPGDPRGLSALFISPDTGKIRVRKNICIGCGLCENRCPTEPRAITVTPHVEPLDPIIA